MNGKRYFDQIVLPCSCGVWNWCSGPCVNLHLKREARFPYMLRANVEGNYDFGRKHYFSNMAWSVSSSSSYCLIWQGLWASEEGFRRPYLLYRYMVEEYCLSMNVEPIVDQTLLVHGRSCYVILGCVKYRISISGRRFATEILFWIDKPFSNFEHPQRLLAFVFSVMAPIFQMYCAWLLRKTDLLKIARV